jgi:hypothetical protein
MRRAHVRWHPGRSRILPFILLRLARTQPSLTPAKPVLRSLDEIDPLAKLAAMG